MFKGYIYKITNNINNKVYIGQTTRTVSIRYKNHLYNAQRGRREHLYEAIRTYGGNNFSVETLAEAFSKEKLDELEIYYIAFYESRNPQKGYNIALGGGRGLLGYNHSLESKKKISEASKALIRTPEHCKKISESQKGHANHIQGKEERDKRSKSLKRAYLEDRHRIVKAGWTKGKHRSEEDVKNNSDRQVGKKKMYLISLRVKCIVFKPDQETFLSNGWLFGNPKDFKSISIKEAKKFNVQKPREFLEKPFIN